MPTSVEANQRYLRVVVSSTDASGKWRSEQAPERLEDPLSANDLEEFCPKVGVDYLLLPDNRLME
jgi:hypothetical protein